MVVSATGYTYEVASISKQPYAVSVETSKPQLAPHKFSHDQLIAVAFKVQAH